MPIIKVSESDIKASEDAILVLKNHFLSLSEKKGRAITYSIRTYGCQLNESDSEKLSGMFEAMGLTEAPDTDGDIVIFNTCSIRENAEDRLFGNLGVLKAAKESDKYKIIMVCGCMMKVGENVEKIRKSFPYVDIVFDPQEIHLMPIYLMKKLETKKQLSQISEDDYIADDSLLPISRKRKFRALVPIMYGCNNFCTYCIVPYTRGRERSRDFDSIIGQLESLSKEGYKEILLLGQNVNSYGKDSDDKRGFPELLRAACSIEGFSRVRFMTSHPRDLSNEVIDIMASYENMETHLHLPVQSGSDEVLKRMNRHYTRKQYLETVEYFRKKVPNGSLSTDIIVGFPGETDQDFEDTLSLVRECKYDSAFTFQYSIRPGTKAADYPDQVSSEVVTERFGRLLELQNSLVYESNKGLIGSSQEILIEGESSTAGNILTGRTRSNHLVNFTIPNGFIDLDGKKINLEDKNSDINADSFEGRMCKVKITDARPYSVEGILESFING